MDFDFPSYCELPASDSNIKLMFDMLDINIILQLWISIMTEKQVNVNNIDSYSSKSKLSAVRNI